jgi:hypothetical protein
LDFTVRKYQSLLAALKDAGYSFQTFSHFFEKPDKQVIILRHDVEKYYENALEFARIQKKLGIKATYYFRFSKRYYKEEIVEEIASLGHEIGYHYDDLAKCKGNYQKAIERFEKNLNQLRAISPITSICMDGSPLSKYDNRDLWKKYDYRDFDLLAEPYLDINFNKVFYLTDTGRRWDGKKVSIRDKVAGNSEYQISDSEYRNSFQFLFHSTNDIISAAKNKQLPDQMMITFHPQRWTNKPLPWVKELVWQSIKNQVKRFLIK